MADLQRPSAGQNPSRLPTQISRRNFLVGATAMGIAAGSGAPRMALAQTTAVPIRPPLRMVAGHQHDHSVPTLKLLSALGVNHICSALPSAKFDEQWSVAKLIELRKYIESFGIALDGVPLPLSARHRSAEILFGKAADRDREIEVIGRMIRNAGEAGIPMATYSLSADDPLHASPKKTYWDRLEYFLMRVVPVAEKARVKLAFRPQPTGFLSSPTSRDSDAVPGTVAGLQRFVSTHPSEYHGLSFCQGTIAERLVKPRAEIGEVIRWFGTRGKIFNVHFRNIRGGFLNFNETRPDYGDVDMPAALRIYGEVGYRGMIMPDHVPSVEGDPDHYKSYSFSFGYIQALVQVLGEQW